MHQWMIYGAITQFSHVRCAWRTRGWKEMLRLDKLPAFNGLASLFESDPTAWREMYNSTEPHKVTMPGKLRMSYFQGLPLGLVIIRAYIPICIIGRCCTTTLSE